MNGYKIFKEKIGKYRCVSVRNRAFNELHVHLTSETYRPVSESDLNKSGK